MKWFNKGSSSIGLLIMLLLIIAFSFSLVGGGTGLTGYPSQSGTGTGGGGTGGQGLLDQGFNRGGGGTLPTPRPLRGSDQIIVTTTLAPGQKNLQLRTFILITPTPAPFVPMTAGIIDERCGYTGSGPGREGVVFDESEILLTFSPQPPAVAGPGGSIRLWAGDENSIVLGISDINGTYFPITQHPGSGVSSASYPNLQIGAPYTQGGTDNAGRPVFPALFVTDLTINGPDSKAGDWQQGGTPIPPHFVSGTWIEGTVNGSSYDRGALPNGKNVINEVWSLGPGGVAPPPGSPAYSRSAFYGTEVRWDVDTLRQQFPTIFVTGHAYRVQFMVHDGDNSNADVGQGCATIQL